MSIGIMSDMKWEDIVIWVLGILVGLSGLGLIWALIALQPGINHSIVLKDSVIVWFGALTAFGTLALAFATALLVRETKNSRVDIADQRLKSIKPNLQISNAYAKYENVSLDEESMETAIVPILEILACNVGAGPALHLGFSAKTVMVFSHNEGGSGQKIMLDFQLPEATKQYFLDHSSEPTKFILKLVSAEKFSIGCKEGVLEITARFTDIDGHLFEPDLSTAIPPNMKSALVFKNRIIPGDDEYSKYL
jgi:hypothetical protein